MFMCGCHVEDMVWKINEQGYAKKAKVASFLLFVDRGGEYYSKAKTA